MQSAVEPTTDCKQIYVACSRPRIKTQVQVAPSDTASDVLGKAGLNADDYVLLKPADMADFSPTEAVFPEISDGIKLHAVPDCTVGA